MSPYVLTLVGALLVLTTASLIGVVWDAHARQNRARMLLPSRAGQARARGVVEYHIHVQDSVSG